MKFRALLLMFSMLLGLCARPAVAQDQAFPTKPITMIVVFAAGGPTDVMARIVAEHMGRTLGQQIIIENVGGAGGTIGGARGAKAAPDGYTLTVGSLGSHAAAPGMYKNMTFDPRELEPVGMIAGTPGYVVVRKEFPAKTFAEFLAYAKANPGKITSANAGVGSTPHLQCLLLASQTGMEFVYVPYRGSAPAMNDLVAGQIDSMCDLAPTVVPQVQAGTVRALLVSMPDRAATTPDVPTAKEAGIPAYLFAGWNAVFAPKDTPQSIADKLSQALLAALADADVQKKITDLGAIPAVAKDATPAALRSLLATEIDKWKRILADARVTAQ